MFTALKPPLKPAAKFTLATIQRALDALASKAGKAAIKTGLIGGGTLMPQEAESQTQPGIGELFSKEFQSLKRDPIGYITGFEAKTLNAGEDELLRQRAAKQTPQTTPQTTPPPSQPSQPASSARIPATWRAPTPTPAPATTPASAPIPASRPPMPSIPGGFARGVAAPKAAPVESTLPPRPTNIKSASYHVIWL